MAQSKDGAGSGVDFAFRFRYETFRSLLERNGAALQILSDIEADLNHLPDSDARIRGPVERLLKEALLMAQELNLLASDRYFALYHVLDGIRGTIRSRVRTAVEEERKPLAVFLDDEEALDEELTGGKAAAVAALRRHFKEAVPGGFVLTTAAYRLFLSENDLSGRIRLMLKDIDVVADRHRFGAVTKTVRGWIRSAAVPGAIRGAIASKAAALGGGGAPAWAVRSSATSEDGRFTFAGQFDTKLGVPAEELEDAYRAVLASRFSDRAVLYRVHCGFREVSTPMAVLFMPMVEAVAAGVVYTKDPQAADSGRMVVCAVPGLGDKLVAGEAAADTFHLSRGTPPGIVERIPASTGAPEESSRPSGYLPGGAVEKIASMALEAAEAFGYDMDMEWALDREGRVRFLQGRRLAPATAEAIRDRRMKKEIPLVAGGVTVFPGLAEGRVVPLPPGAPAGDVPRGSVVVVEAPRPDLGAILPRIAALLVAGGNPVGHLATLVREFSVPCIFKVGDGLKRLVTEKVVSVDATRREIFRGSCWPGIRERVLSRIAAAGRPRRSGPLHDLVLALNLTDPDSSSFKAKGCRSLHDALRFMHEMSVRTMFAFGDEQRFGLRAKKYRLRTDLPLRFLLINLDRFPPGQERDVEPEKIESVPFRAFWRGVSDPRLFWPERWERELSGFSSDFREAVLGGARGPRRPRDPNYVIFAADYMNLNARFAYHYAMVDAIVGEGDENNHVHFRFRSGGAADDRRVRRARFLERVLRASRFGVDRTGDLVEAWLRRYPRSDCEEALEMLGRLTVCSRQLDVLMAGEGDEKRFAEDFLEGKFRSFA